MPQGVGVQVPPRVNADIMTLDKLYELIKSSLSSKGFQVNPFRNIQYGCQFLIFKENQSILLRLFSSKKGLKIDYSQADNHKLKNSIEKIITPIEKKYCITNKAVKANKKQDPISSKDPETLIGVDESGKGDYFGPLVVAGVYAGPKENEILKELGVKDSKELNDTTIIELSEQIKEVCPYSLILMGNASYNTLYSKMNNLNHILSWAHTKAIENVLEQQRCDYALSDKFASQTLIQAGLVNKGINIKLIERTKAESNIAVAAASIIARANYVDQLKKIGNVYKQNFPKGCSPKTLLVAKQFYEKHGKEELGCIAKLHFKLTEQIIKDESKN